MSKRFPTEVAINMNLARIMILQQPELALVTDHNYFDDQHPCHIYFICKRARMFLIPEKTKVTDDELKLVFGINNKGIINEVELSNPHGQDPKEVKVYSEYPFNKFKIFYGDTQFLNAKVATFLQAYSRGDFLDLEVLYIGQSYGVDGARTAPDRLVSHSTLQNIYAEAMINNPDSEIYLALASFEQITMLKMDGTTEFSQDELVEDEVRGPYLHSRVIQKGLNEQQIINFTEAALIRYFQPKYNKIYKDSFPNPAHSTYSECYELDINTIVVELQTQEMVNCSFYSDRVGPEPAHIGVFLLRSSAERKSMFDYEG